jgi:hypothetical protein
MLRTLVFPCAVTAIEFLMTLFNPLAADGTLAYSQPGQLRDYWPSPGVCASRRAHTRPCGTLTGCMVYALILATRPAG